jgi:CTP synthase
VCRSDYPITDDIRDKIALFCDVDRRAVVPLPTLPIIYETPLVLEEAGLGQLIVDMLHLPAQEQDLGEWRQLVGRMKQSNQSLPIAIVGKYVELRDSYISVKEALHHAAVYHERDVDIHWIHSEDLEKDGDRLLRSAQGIVAPGGFGVRGIEGMVIAARYARENKIPYLGLCLGMQAMVIEYARYVLGSSEPNSTEFDLETAYPVIDLLPEQRKVEGKGGAMRLGAYPCHLVKGTRAAAAYGEGVVYERHRHRFEFNNDFRETLERAGMVFSGLSPEGRLVEISEVREHPFMVGTQFHPEFRSRPDRPHPLFRDFIGVAKEVLREGAQPPLSLV